MKVQNVGIDVAAKDFCACLKIRQENGEIEIKGSRKFPNNPKGFRELESWLKKKCSDENPVYATMEATGVYYESLAYHLHDLGYKVHVLLPNKVKNYFKFLNLKSKTDKLEAQALAELGLIQQLSLWEAPSPVLRQLKGLFRESISLAELNTLVNNRLHAEQAKHAPNKGTIKRLRQQLRLIEKQIKQVKNDMIQLYSKDEKLKQAVDRITQVKGLGIHTVLGIIAETDGFSQIKKKSQLVSYAGYDVIENQSGTSINGKTRISKKGNRHIRRALHFPAITVVKYHEEFKDLYDRVYERTKVKMKGYVAVQRKLLVLIYTLYKNGTAYDPNYFKNRNSAKEVGRELSLPTLDDHAKSTASFGRANL